MTNLCGPLAVSASQRRYAASNDLVTLMQQRLDGPDTGLGRKTVNILQVSV